MKNIDTIQEFNSDYFTKKYVKKSQPAIIKSNLFDWPAANQLSLDTLKDIIPNNSTKVSYSKDQEFTRNPSTGEMTGYANLPFHEFIDKLNEQKNTDNEFYYLSSHLFSNFPELQSYIKIPNYLADKKNISIRFWVGAQGVKTCLHYDFRNNFFIQLEGTKRFVLYNPFETKNLYPYPQDTKAFYVSQVKIESPDIKAHPRFRRTRAYDITVGPGDILFLPPGWWHKVYTLENSISVNFWWEIYLRQAVVPTYLPLLKTRMRGNTSAWFKSGEL